MAKSILDLDKIVIFDAEKPDRNGMVFTKDALEKAAIAFNAQDQSYKFVSFGFGQCPVDMSHIIEDIKMDGNSLVAKVKILDTDAGEFVKSLPKCSYSFVSGGVFQDKDEDGNVTGFKLTHISIVSKKE